MDKKTKRLVIGLLVIIAVLAGFIIFNYSVSWFDSQQSSAYSLGYQQAALTLIQQSRNCSIVPLYVGNQTFSFVDVSCLQGTG